ncbi:unnamed protein product [Arctia plantaginis]|uniref:Uncharacterized protein n=1 Tax=Arctia plantaginis TaxID=874455 RepID=A0A8S1BF27_ARCPL|nr:unnamed protein product [Arctia plantaginis]
MIVLKVATVFFLALTVGAEKKIELQDIEEDNLKSEKESVIHKSDQGSQNSGSGTGPGLVPFDLVKNNLLRYFGHQPPPPQQRYVHQYAVTETPERSSTARTVQYSPPTAPQQAMVGYLSNFPMQVYLIPQYYFDHTLNNRPQINQQSHSQYQPQGETRVAPYQTAPSNAIQTQSNYIEVPAYVAPTGKTYVPQYTSPVYVGYQAQPTASPTQATVTPVETYQVPVIEYTPKVVQPTNAPTSYYHNPHYNDNNSVDDEQVHEDGQRQYNIETEIPLHKQMPEFPRHYNSRVPIREDYRPLHSNTITELPHPNPVLLRGSPSHLAHIPKALPVYRPLTKPVYQGGLGQVSSTISQRPHDVYGPPPFKRRPTSLIDSYIPSKVQIEYLKRGLVKEPSAVYDALASGRLPHLIPRNYERGFLPNQMYHTGAGAVTYGHYKRTPKVDKVQQ